MRPIGRVVPLNVHVQHGDRRRGVHPKESKLSLTCAQVSG
jgi:hypothetical protein